MTAPPTRRSQHSEAGGVWIPLPPDPAVLSALGGGHSLESAIADIIDNSIDAEASTVRVRFLVGGDELLAIQIRDDGKGMTPELLEQALRLGRRRDYADSDLGHFGIGLKAASMRFAEVLTVYTAAFVGDTLRYSALEMSTCTDQPELGARSFSHTRAETGYHFGDSAENASSGTVVQWAGIKGASASQSAQERREWLDAVVEKLRFTLGLAYHRMIDAGDIRIELDTFDMDQDMFGVPRTVEAVDPFGYHISGRKGFPVELSGALPSGNIVTARCHILPPKGHDRLHGAKQDWQGLYIYRNNRLLTLDAGWHGLTMMKPERRLSRIEIDLTDELLTAVSPTPEKNGVLLHPDFVRVLTSAVSADHSIGFASYLEEAVSAWKDSNKRSTEKPVTRIESGLPNRLIESIGEGFGWRHDKDPVGLRWTDLDVDDLFKIDLQNRELCINQRYASVFGGEETASAHLFSTMLYLLTEQNFTRDSHLRSTTIEHLERIGTVLLAAIASNSVNGNREAAPFRGTPADALKALLRATRRTSLDAAEEAISSHPGHEYRSIPAPGKATTISSQEISIIEAATEPGQSPGSESPQDILNDAAGQPPEHKAAIIDREDIEAAPATTSTPSGDLDCELQESGRQRHSQSRPALQEQGALTKEELEVFELYCSGMTISEIAHQTGAPENDVVLALTSALFGERATEDDPSLAPYHGMAYSPEERERILHLYRGGRGLDILDIARQVGRTPFAISWRLLDSPRRPVPIDKRVRRAVRRRTASEN